MVIAYISGHRSICKYKQNERAKKIAALPPAYREALTSNEKSILATPLDQLVANIKKGEIMIEDAEKWASNCDLKGPLAGIPGTGYFP